METMTMNVQLVSPTALVAVLAGPNSNESGRAGMLWRGLRTRVDEELRYRRVLRELRRLDDRDLDDLNLGRGDLPGLARCHAWPGLTLHAKEHLAFRPGVSVCVAYAA
jgi:uncharacterized protein YjiS (DUF1127 family)